VKRDVALAFWSSFFVWISFQIGDLGFYLEYFSQTWAIVAKILSGLILLMNFTIIFLSMAKRVRDWKKLEDVEGQEEFKKRKPKK
jgi:hypothetical protein